MPGGDSHPSSSMCAQAHGLRATPTLAVQASGRAKFTFGGGGKSYSNAQLREPKPFDQFLQVNPMLPLA